MRSDSLESAEVITIGNELLSGAVADTNFTFLARELLRCGVTLSRHVTVGDSEAEIVSAMRDAVGRTALLVVTGGLGVTPDDKTRDALARLAGVPLIPDEELRGEIEVFFKDRRIRMPAINASQAALPRGAHKIRNSEGLAPGLRMRIRRCEVFAFPGVPAELRALTHEGLLPFVLNRTDGRPVPERELRTWGKGETTIAERMAGFAKNHPDVMIAYLPEPRGVTVRLRFRIGTFENSSERLDALTDEAADTLGSLVYSTRREELPEVVAMLLMLYRKSVAVAESCTGGRLSDYLTCVRGSSLFYREGIIPYSTGAKVSRADVPRELIDTTGTISHEVAERLAEGARERASADIGIGITGIAGPEPIEGKPVGRVYAALSTAGGTWWREWNIPGNRDKVKERAARSALNLIRLHLLGETI